MPALPAVVMSGLWVENLFLFLGVLAILLALVWSLRRPLRPKRWWRDADWSSEERVANLAWGQHRAEAYDAALEIAYANGDLTDALHERLRTVGDSFRGLGDGTLETVAPMRQFGEALAIDPWSRRV